MKVRAGGSRPSFGSFGNASDNALAESVRVSMHVQVLNSQKWQPQIDLTVATFADIKAFHFNL